MCKIKREKKKRWSKKKKRGKYFLERKNFFFKEISRFCLLESTHLHHLKVSQEKKRLDGGI
jgi:hypothetical protein